MDLLQKTQKICQVNKIEPARSKGQNFLINDSVYDEIIKSANLKADDVVLEVGPGLGFLTRKLAEKAQKVITVELDDVLAELLKINLAKEKIANVEIRNENILDFNFTEKREATVSLAPPGEGRCEGAFELKKYKIVANIPYNITSVFLRKFLETNNRPEMMVLMLQKEVAERIIAKPGQMSILAVSVQFFAEGEIICNVPAKDFWPAPRVDSAVIKLVAREDNSIFTDLAYQKRFFRLVKHGFVSKRKMLKNNLSAGYHVDQEKVIEVMDRVGLIKTARAQELSIEEWKKLLVEVEGNML